MMGPSTDRSGGGQGNRLRVHSTPRILPVIVMLFLVSTLIKNGAAIAVEIEDEKSVVQGQRFVIGMTGPIMGLDWQKAFDPGSMTIAQAISETLYRRFDSGDVQPHLAAAMPENVAEGVFRIRLRPGIRFSNGDPLSERDVIFSLDRVKTPTVNQVTVHLFWRIQAITPDGDGVLRISFSGPSRELAALLSRTETGILSQRRVAQLGRTYGTAGVEGTGPFTFRDWEKGLRITLEKCNNYWAANTPARETLPRGQSPSDTDVLSSTADKPPVPFPGAIVVKYEKEPGQIVRQLLNGSMDMAIGLNTVAMERLGQHLERFDIIEHSKPHMVQLYVNRRMPPFDQPRLRKALSWAIDRARLLTSTCHGKGTVAESVIPASLWENVPRETRHILCFNPQAAEQDLLAYGQQGGKPVSFTLMYTTDPFFERIAVELKRQLEQVGFQVTLQSREKAAILAAFYQNPTHWQVILEDWYDWRRLDDPLAYLRLQFETTSSYNKTAFSDEHVDRIFSVRNTNDSLQRSIPTLLGIIAEDCTVIPLFSPHSIIVVSKRLQGLTWSDAAIPFFDKAWRRD